MRFSEQNVRAPDENACTAGYNNVGFVCTALPTFLGPARALHMVSKVLWVVYFPRFTAGANFVGNCCTVRLHTTAIPDATTARKELHINNDLEVVHPLSGSSST